MTLLYSFLDEALIRYRRAVDGETVNASLPDLFLALYADQVRDFPALRPHQRHPWHAFLVQIAAIALHRAGTAEPFTTAADWRAALLALTPEHADGAAWCLVTPAGRPALLQPPVALGDFSTWKNDLFAADELDMLVTSKGHDLKPARGRQTLPDDWLFSLLSLQTQEGFLGAGNYGISRMNGGFASRPALGVVPAGGWGARWLRDIGVLLENRQAVIETMGFQEQDGIALVWLVPWDGTDSLPFSGLDPHYIEICRRIRLLDVDGKLQAKCTGSKAARISAKERNGMTGDTWMPIDIANAKALTVPAAGFHYKLAAELLFGTKYQPPHAQYVRPQDGKSGLVMLAQAVTRGQGKTEGYHERRIPISPKMRALFSAHQTDLLGKIARERVEAIAEIRKLVWSALCLLFNNGISTQNDTIKDRASRFAAAIERNEDPRFFDDLTKEVEATDPEAARLSWLLGLAARGAQVIQDAFHAGPRSGMQRYKAQSAALARYHGGLRGEKSPLPILANHYRHASQSTKQNPTEEVQG